MPESITTEEPVLQVRNICKSFSSLRAVDDCSFAIEKGAIVGLIGPNGAGKSTTFDIAAGATKPDSGQIIFRDEDIGALKPYQRALKGLGRTFQTTRVFPKMTLMENMFVASPTDHRLHERTRQYLDLVNLYDRRDQYASALSFGQQKLLELARILMLEPELILLDEPAAGINPTLLNSLLAFIHELRNEWGKTFLIIEHNMDLVMNNCDKVIVMNAGRVIAEGTGDVIQANEEVLEAYFGKSTHTQGAASHGA